MGENRSFLPSGLRRRRKRKERDPWWEKEDIYRMLREEEIWHEITEHPAVYNMEEMAQIQLPYPEADAKNLFVRDSKRRDYYLITSGETSGWT